MLIRDQRVTGYRHIISTRQQYMVCLCPSLHYFEAQRMDVTNHNVFFTIDLFDAAHSLDSQASTKSEKAPPTLSFRLERICRVSYNQFHAFEEIQPQFSFRRLLRPSTMRRTDLDQDERPLSAFVIGWQAQRISHPTSHR